MKIAAAVKMKDVAKRAGVHQTTVSRALRGDPLLPESTRKRLVALAEEMGYRRNPLVSALFAERRRGRPSGHGAVLAVLGPGARPGAWRGGAGTYARLFRHMEEHAGRLGYRLEEFALEQPSMGPGQLRRILLARGVRGILLAPLPIELEILDFDFSDFGVIALRLALRTPALDRVAPDYYSAMADAMEKLRRTGHKKLAFLSDRLVDEKVRHRSLGAWLSARQFAPGEILPPLILEHWTRKDFVTWLGKSRPDAIVTPVYADYIRVKAWLEKARWKAPGHLSLVNLDCHAETREAGIVHNLELEAISAINFLARKVEGADFGVPEDACRLSVPGRWRDGELFAPRDV
jgi:DNA-binding LacI/PurR family transcriptional regulator